MEITPEHPFICAEVGSNWRSFEDCENSIKTAHICGADAVKFQMFDDKALYGFQCSQNIPGGLPMDWVPRLSQCARDLGIDFMCTAFSPEMVDLIDPYVTAHKIASSDITDPAMLSAVKATDKLAIISCGGATFDDIHNAIAGNGADWEGFGHDSNTVLLYCNSVYPSRRWNLFAMEDLKGFGLPIGLSDHSLDVIYPALSAVKHFGAVVIEKHFKLFDMKTPDAPHSLSPDEFKEMVDAIRYMTVDIFDKESYLFPTKDESHMWLRNQRRLIAIEDIVPGMVMKRGVNYGAYRALHDQLCVLNPMDCKRVESKTAKTRIACGEPIRLDSLGD